MLSLSAVVRFSTWPFVRPFILDAIEKSGCGLVLGDGNDRKEDDLDGWIKKTGKLLAEVRWLVKELICL